jgi:colanic acid biosynthesis glycosyl transferase WcaI
MQITAWGINYPPEKVGIAPCSAALCEFLAETGHQVTMLTSFPYYPTWQKQPEDRHKLFGSERMNGVRVLRCWHYVPRQANSLKRILHELSFVITSFCRLLTLPNPGLLIVISPPLFLGIAARLICLLRGGRYLMHIQDLQPDAAIKLGMVRSARFIQFLRALESAAYRGAWRISGISRGMLAILKGSGVLNEKLVYLPNGTYPAKPVLTGRSRRMNRYRSDQFLVVYSGNVGGKQGLCHLMAAAAGLLDTSIQFIICGDGVEKVRLLESAKGLRNVTFKALLEEGEYQEMLADADLVVVSQIAGSGGASFPSKFLSSCAAGRPVLAICDAGSELANVVRANECGIVVVPGFPEEIILALRKLAMQPKQREKMGIAARHFGEQFLWSAVLGRFVHEIGL